MKTTDDDPDVPPACDGGCGMSHNTGGRGTPPVEEICPRMLERQRYQRRRWARRNPMDEYDRQQRRLRGE